MADQVPFRPSYDTCDEVTAQCPVEFTMYGTYLSKGAAYFFGIAFAFLLILQIYLGIRARAYSFSAWLAAGTILEVIGYWARTRLADNPWSLNSFIITYLALLMGPTLVAAAISVTFKHIVIWYGPEWSVMRPVWYPWVFVGTDLISITVQIIGGGATAMAVTGDGSNETLLKLGEYMVIGGVAFQVANMILCALLMIIYWRRRRGSVNKGETLVSHHSPERYAPDYRQSAPKLVHRLMSQGRISMSRATATDAEAKRVRIFCYALAVAYTGILIRCIYR